MSVDFELPSWPQAQSLGLCGRYRAAPEDFRVDERSGWRADGSGEHLLCHVEKRGENSAWVADRLARTLGIPERDVGWCGAKDRHAVTRQWFSLRDPRGTGWPDGAPRTETGADGGHWRLLATERHGRKLRRGDHAGNAFELRLDVEPDALPEPAIVAAHLERGVPNYFGPQRFGRENANLARALRWVEGGRLPPRGNRRGHLLSAARALIFNEVVAARVRAGRLDAVLDGDVLAADGTATGPLWGRGRSAAEGAAASLEADALAPWRDWCVALEHVGLEQARRPLLLRPAVLDVGLEAGRLRLAFELPPGAFATAIIAALGRFTDASRTTGATTEAA
jgi:tRNA pseudouridine13 synthase